MWTVVSWGFALDLSLEYHEDDQVPLSSLHTHLRAVLTAGFFVVTLRKNHCLQVIFSTLTVCFSLLAAGVDNVTVNKAAGYVGFFCGSSAIYAAFALLYREELGISLPGIAPTHYI